MFIPYFLKRVLDSPWGSKAFYRTHFSAERQLYEIWTGFVLWPFTSLPVPQWGPESFLRNSTSGRKWITTLVTCFLICYTTTNAAHVRAPAAAAQMFLCSCSAKLILTWTLTPLWEQRQTLLRDRAATCSTHKSSLRWQNMSRQDCLATVPLLSTHCTQD